MKGKADLFKSAVYNIMMYYVVTRGRGGEVAPDTNKIFMEETNMKKIIATVLAMVMALALCTTAFAATTYTLDKADGNEMVEKTATNYVTRYVDKVDGKVYVVTDDATAATHKLFINGKDGCQGS